MQKLTFSKLLVIYALLIMTIATVVSFVFAWHDKQTVSDVTNTIIISFSVIPISYCAKTAAEKCSRNKYKIDEDGHPFDCINKEENNEH